MEQWKPAARSGYLEKSVRMPSRRNCNVNSVWQVNKYDINDHKTHRVMIIPNLIIVLSTI